MNKIPGVGKETSNKLKDLHTAGLATPLLNYRINTGKRLVASLLVYNMTAGREVHPFISGTE